MTAYASMASVRNSNAGIGHHFFERATMRFFGSRVESDVIGGRYFVTSEQPPDGPRAYSIRMAHDDGAISTVGEFCSYATRAAATDAAQILAQALPSDGSEPCLRTWCQYLPGVPLAGTGHNYLWTGSMPMTGELRCTLCGRRKLDA